MDEEAARQKARAIVAKMKPKPAYGDRWLDVDYALEIAAKCEDDPWKIADVLVETMHENAKREERNGKVFLSFRDETPIEASTRLAKCEALENYLMRQFMQRHDLVTTRASENTALRQIFAVKPQWSDPYVSYNNITGLRGMHGGAHFDHTFIFRRRTNGSYVIATHPYNVTEKCRAEWQEIATRTGAVIEFPDDFPSWWYPGATTLIVCYRQELELQQSA